MVIAQPAPFVSTFVDAVDQAIRAHSPSVDCDDFSAIAFFHP